MSRSRVDRRGTADDRGFSLIEIMVSMTILAIVLISTAPLLVGGLKAGRAAQLNLQGKALAQERLEVMRNLPFYVAHQNGQYLDVLDIYFRDLTAVGVTTGAGDICDARTYNAATATYSCRIDDLGVDYRGFQQTVRATFLDFERGTVVPPANYDSQITDAGDRDNPASTLLGVSVTTTWTQGGRTSNYTLRSQLANAQADQSSIEATLRLAALTITSNQADGDVLQFEGGLLNAAGSLTTGSTADLSATAARAGLASGVTETGAAIALTAPPAPAGGTATDPAGKKLLNSCEIACFGKSDVDGNTSVSVALGQPQVSTSAAPVSSSLSRTGSSTFNGFSYGNTLVAAANPVLRLSGRMLSAGSTGVAEVLASKGYLNATGTGANAVVTSGRTSLPSLQIFPTAFAPQGVVKLTLTEASLTCRSGTAPSSVNSNWSGTVSYWTQTGIDGTGLPTGVYVDLPVAPGATALPAPAALTVLDDDLNSDGLPDNATAEDAPLSRWIQAWSAKNLASEAVTVSGGRAATGNLDAVISVLTAPTRLLSNVLDETSAINVSVGTLSCHAEDNR